MKNPKISSIRGEANKTHFKIKVLLIVKNGNCLNSSIFLKFKSYRPVFCHSRLILRFRKDGAHHKIGAYFIRDRVCVGDVIAILHIHQPVDIPLNTSKHAVRPLLEDQEIISPRFCDPVNISRHLDSVNGRHIGLLEVPNRKECAPDIIRIAILPIVAAQPVIRITMQEIPHRKNLTRTASAVGEPQIFRRMIFITNELIR